MSVRTSAVFAAIVWLGTVPSLHAQVKPINCVVVMQYSPDTSQEDQNKGIASNNDLMESAKSRAATLGKDDTELREVNSSTKLPGVLDAFKDKGKKCCKKIEILSHGSTDGSIDLPYELPKTDELSDKDKAAFGRQLGGPAAKTGWGRERLDEFVKEIKRAYCKDEKPAVSFQGCYTAVEGGIAEQVSKKGISTRGITGTCDFGFVEEEKQGHPAKKTWPGPRPKAGGTSEEKSFPAK